MSNSRQNHRRQHQALIFLESFFYSSGQMFLGLLLHPYRSMQLLVKNKILLPFALYPSFFGLLMLFLLRVDWLGDYYTNNAYFAFVCQFYLFFCLYWQLALCYLWLRFYRAFSRETHEN